MCVGVAVGGGELVIGVVVLVVGVGDIGLDGDSIDLVSGGLAGLGIHVDDDDIGAFGCQAYGRCPPDATAPSGDDDSAVSKAVHRSAFR